MMLEVLLELFCSFLFFSLQLFLESLSLFVSIQHSACFPGWRAMGNPALARSLVGAFAYFVVQQPESGRALILFCQGFFSLFFPFPTALIPPAS